LSSFLLRKYQDFQFIISTDRLLYSLHFTSLPSNHFYAGITKMLLISSNWLHSGRIRPFHSAAQPISMCSVIRIW